MGFVRTTLRSYARPQEFSNHPYAFLRSYIISFLSPHLLQCKRYSRRNWIAIGQGWPSTAVPERGCFNANQHIYRWRGSRGISQKRHL